MRIFSYRGAVVAAKHFGDALDVLGIDSAAGVFDISGGLKTVPAEILAAYLPAAPLDAKDVEFKRIEAQGLAEKLNAAVLDKAKLQAEVLRLSTDNNALGSSRAHLESELAKAREQIDALSLNPLQVVDDWARYWDEISKEEARACILRVSIMLGQYLYRGGKFGLGVNGPSYECLAVRPSEKGYYDVIAKLVYAPPTLEQLESERVASLRKELASAQEKIALYEEIEADRKAEAERGVRATFDAEEVDEAELEAIADTWLKNSHSCGVETELPAVSYGEPAGLSPIYDESGFEIGASSPPPAFDPIATAEAVRDELQGDPGLRLAPSGGTSPATSPAYAGEERSAVPPPVGPEASVQKRRGGVTAHPSVEKISEILKQDWPAGVPVSAIVSRIEREIDDRPSWASDAGRIGIHATKLGLKRPEGFKRNPVKAVSVPASAADFLSDAAASAALVPVVEKPARDLRSLSRMAQLHGETVQRMADEGMTDGEIANEVNNTARRNDWLTAATAKSVRLEMERVR